MGSGFWVVMGAAIGTVGSILTTWLNAHLSQKSKFPEYDKGVKALLIAMLTAGPKWRKIKTLAAVTGLSEQEAKEYLIELGARGSETDGNLWGLISRNPLSEIDPSN